MAHAQLVALVVTYNRLAQLKTTITALCATPLHELSHILVFDNASDDGTSEWLASLSDPRVVTVTSDANLGGAGGFEQGMRAAVAQFDPDWIVLMDDDARPMPQTLATFHSSDRAGHDAYAAAVYYPNGEICDMNRPWVNPFANSTAFLRTLLNGRDGFHLPLAAYDELPRPIGGTSFVGLFLSRHAIETAGYPDGRLFIYGEDVLYTLGINQAGLRMAFDPALVFEHDCSVASAHDVLSPLWKAYYYHRNQVFVVRAAAGRFLSRPILALRRVLWRRGAKRYGAKTKAYRTLLELGLKDGYAGKLDRPHAEIAALSDEK